jgi:hypothetical protein
MYGINQRVEQTADAYMGNPKALEQKYAQSKDIFDLIALNTINEKVSAASREMRLRAGGQGKPPTLYEKAEAQAVDNTKKEIIDEQAGVMQNKLRQQQEAQKRLMQAAGAPGIAGAMPQPSGGIAGVPAPNMQGMAGGGIVAFNGETGSAVDGNQGEEEARRAYAARRQQPPRAEPRAEPQSGGMQAGLATLLGIRPEDVYRQRSEEVARGTNLTPEERAAKERHIQERAAFDKDSELTNFLLGMAGRSTPGLAIAAGGAAAQNTRNQALAARQRAEGELIDIGPESRKAGFKAGESAYGPSMQGLASGVQSAANMAATGEAAASRALTAREAELGRAENRANTLHRTILESVQKDPAYVKAAEALALANQLALGGDPKRVAARNQQQQAMQQLYSTLYNMHKGLMNPNAGGNQPPAQTPPQTPPQTAVPFSSLPTRP